MNSLQFIAALASALAWPATVLLIALALRRPILDLIPLLQRIKLKDLELEFREKLAAVTEKEYAGEKGKKFDSSDVKAQTYYHQLAQLSPAAALMEAWLKVEAAAASVFQRDATPGMKVFVTPRDIFEYLRSHKQISESEYQRAIILRELRNKAAHGGDISGINPDVINAYVTLALDLAEKLKQN